MKEVIIKVYVEKETAAKKRRAIRIPILSHRKTPPPPRGLDRRAELLAYTKKLRRNADNSSPSKKTSTKKYNNKKWRWSSISIRKINLPFRRRSNRQWRYETIHTEDYNNNNNDNNTGSSCCGQNMKRKFRFCEKLKSFIKKLSCTNYQCIG